MAVESIRVHTSAFYRGLPVTVVGYADGPLIAVAAYATPFELALGVITVEADGPGERYRVAGHDGRADTLTEAARIVAQRREAKDRDESY